MSLDPNTVADLAQANKLRIDDLYEKTGAEPFEIELPAGDGILVHVEVVDNDNGFDAYLVAAQVESNNFTAFRFDMVFPDVLAFSGASKGTTTDDWAAVFGRSYTGRDYNGRVGGYTSSLHPANESGTFCVLSFSGPSIAAEGITFSGVQFSGPGGTIEHTFV